MENKQTGSYWSEWGIEATEADTSEDGVVVYTYPGGWKRRVKANRPVRDNNPGGLKFSSDEKAREAGALGRDKAGFGVFPDWITGKRAADKLWDSYRKQGFSIHRAVQWYTTTGREKRIKDLTEKATGWVDRDGKPVTENTPLSKLTDEQFAILRDYNDMQLEGWLTNLGKAKIEWTPPSQGPHTSRRTQPTASPSAQAPPAKPPVPAVPTQPRSSLGTPQSPIHAASFHMDTPGGVEPYEQENKLLTYDPSEGFPMPPADPLAHYRCGRFSSPFPSLMEDSTIPRLADLLRPNLLASPPQLDFFSSGKGNPLR